jgi:hypothetical protein
MIYPIYDQSRGDTPVTDAWFHESVPSGFRPVEMCRRFEREAAEARAALQLAEMDLIQERWRNQRLLDRVAASREPVRVKSISEFFELFAS